MVLLGLSANGVHLNPPELTLLADASIVIKDRLCIAPPCNCTFSKVSSSFPASLNPHQLFPEGDQLLHLLGHKLLHGLRAHIGVDEHIHLGDQQLEGMDVPATDGLSGHPEPRSNASPQ